MRSIKQRPAPHVPDAAEVAKLNAFMQTRDEATFDELRTIVGWDLFEDGVIMQHAQDADLYDTFQ